MLLPLLFLPSPTARISGDVEESVCDSLGRREGVSERGKDSSLSVSLSSLLSPPLVKRISEVFLSWQLYEQCVWRKRRFNGSGDGRRDRGRGGDGSLTERPATGWLTIKMTESLSEAQKGAFPKLRNSPCTTRGKSRNLGKAFLQGLVHRRFCK